MGHSQPGGGASQLHKGSAVWLASRKTDSVTPPEGGPHAERRPQIAVLRPIVSNIPSPRAPRGAPCHVHVVVRGPPCRCIDALQPGRLHPTHEGVPHSTRAGAVSLIRCRGRVNGLQAEGEPVREVPRAKCRNQVPPAGRHAKAGRKLRVMKKKSSDCASGGSGQAAKQSNVRGIRCYLRVKSARLPPHRMQQTRISRSRVCELH